MSIITNEQVLRLIFGEQWIYAHVTSFHDDPTTITNDRLPICWAGDYLNNFTLEPQSNQFFCVSLFTPDDKGRSRRRKANFVATHVIGLDDVMEKLPPEQVARLPQPSYKMNSSKNSEQWFYVLTTPETDRKRVDNLLEQLIAKGLAPDGTDPGMRGVTRYLRLPEGVNTKAKRVAENGGVPYQCVVTEWNPQNKYTMEQLAAPFNVDLDAERHDARVKGCVEIADHPIAKLFEIKSILSPGRYDITCPWVDEHTNGDDNGTALFTNDDGSIGFQCHHGHCEGKTSGDVIDYLDEDHPGIRKQFNSWRNHYQSMAAFNSIAPPAAPPPPIQVYDFMGEQVYNFKEAPPSDKPIQMYDFMGNVATPDEKKTIELVDYQGMLSNMYQHMHDPKMKHMLAEQFLYAVEPLGQMEKIHWHEAIIKTLNWSQPKLKSILKELQAKWYDELTNAKDFYKDFYFIEPSNTFYCHTIKKSYSVQAFQNSFSHLDEDASTNALQRNLVQKVHNVDYAPGKPPLFTDGRMKTANLWTDDLYYGEPGDCTPWLQHWDKLGWANHRDIHLQFMACTLRQPERKINWALLLAGAEGIGKDLILDPMRRALGDNSNTVEGDVLTGDFNEYLMGYKHVGYNELELGNHRENKAISNKLKPIIAAPPNRIPINAKGDKIAYIRNIASITITSNERVPVYVDDGSRRYHMSWSDFKVRDANNDVKPAHQKYFEDYWNWYNDKSDEYPNGQGGWRHCVYYLAHAVDLYTFNPSRPPPVTDFMRELQQINKSQLNSDLQTMIDERISVFECDLLSLQDITIAFNMHSEYYKLTGKKTTANVLARVVGELGAVTGKRCYINGAQRRMVIIRNHEKYMDMTSNELTVEYTKQMGSRSAKEVNKDISVVLPFKK